MIREKLVSGPIFYFLGEKLRKHRMDLNLRQKDAARIMAVTTDTIRLWEKDKVKPSPQNLSAIQQFLSLKGRDKILSI